jgi:hypothetical protein
MRVLGASIIAAAVLAASPANAVGLGDLAKVVLGGSSVLKKGAEKCGSSLGLSQKDDLALTFARSAAEQALPLSEFTALDTATKTEADTSATNPAFCSDTAKKKTGIMSKVKKAGQDLLKKRLLGGI